MSARPGGPRGRYLARAVVLVVLAIALSCPSLARAGQAGASNGSSATYTATETIPVPPASTYAGSGGGDGWAVALTSKDVYNVFHHDGVLEVACHLQSDASACWAPETITDGSGDNFATSGQPGLWLDQSTGRLYVFATRTSDQTGGVVCIDTTQAASNPDPFCGFTALTAVGDAPLQSGISAISDPAVVGSRWYAFNYVDGAGVSGTQNKMLCFDLASFSACGSQPFSVAIGSGTVSDTAYPPPAVAAIGGRVIVPVTVGGNDALACFDGSSASGCGGSWPVSLGFGYDSSYGAPFPLLDGSGSATGLCLPNGSDPCYSLSGASVSTPAGMTSAIPATSGWNGPAFTLGARVYVPNGSNDEVDCYDSVSSATCANFPKTFSNLSLLYTVNADPQRPTCIWANADSGSGQIQNFDAYTGGACGQGPIRVLASSMVVPTQLCTPFGYTSLQVTSPAPGTYSSGSVAFEDGDGNPLPGIADRPLDNTGTVSLTGLNLGSGTGLPQFLITLSGEQGTPGSVVVKLTWTGVNDPSCVGPGTVVSGGSGVRYLALGDSVPYGHGLANPTKGTKDGLPPDQPPSVQAWPSIVQAGLPGLAPLRDRADSCHLTGSHGAHFDQLAVSGAPSIDNKWTGLDTDCHYPKGVTVPQHKAVFLDELSAAKIRSDAPGLVTIQAGADDIDFAACLMSLLSVPDSPWGHSENCVNVNKHGYQVTKKVQTELDSLKLGLSGSVAYIRNRAPSAQIVLVGYYQIIPSADAVLQGSSPACLDLRASRKGGAWRTSIRAKADFLQAQLNDIIKSVAARFHGVAYFDISSLFNGHEMCTPHTWIFDHNWDAAHPTATGQQQIGQAVIADCEKLADHCIG